MGGKDDKNSTDEVSTVVKLMAALSYMVASSSLTFINKYIYEKYGFKEPKILFLIQCIWNIFVCMCLMCYK